MTTVCVQCKLCKKRSFISKFDAFEVSPNWIKALGGNNFVYCTYCTYYRMLTTYYPCRRTSKKSTLENVRLMTHHFTVSIMFQLFLTAPKGSKRHEKHVKPLGKTALNPTYMILCLQDGFTPAPIKDSCIGYSSSVQLSHHFERLSWEWEQWNLPATVELKSREDREELGTGKRPWNSEGPSWDYPVARVFVNAVNENT